MLCLLLLSLLFAATARAQCWPCNSTGFLVTRYDPSIRCCRVCSAGFACNGTVATPCVPPDHFQRFGGQSNCSVPKNCTGNEFETAAPTATSDRVCRALSRCNNETEFERIAPTATSDRVCTLLRVCNYTQEYELTAPTATTDRVCRPQSSCNLLTQQVASQATRTRDTLCTCRPNFVGTPCSLCENVIPGCHLCHVSANGTSAAECTECLLAFQPVTVNDGLRCVRCETEGCAKCDETNVCIACRAGFKMLSSNTCACDITGCAVCSANGTCDTCHPDFWRTASSACVATTTTTASSSATQTTSTTTTTSAADAAAVNLSAKSSNLLTIAVIGACAGSLAMVAVIGVVAVKARRKRAQRQTCEAPSHLYEAPITVLPNGAYAEPVTLYARRLPEEPIYDIATTTSDEYLDVSEN